MQPLDFDQLVQSSLGFYRVWVIHLGRRYGILRALMKSNGPVSTDDLAERTGLYLRGLNLWCEAAYSLGIVTRRAGRYRLARGMEELLVEETHRDYLGGQMSYLALRSLDYDAFDGFFKEGTVSENTPHLVEAFMEATRWDHTSFLRVVLPRVPEVKSAFHRKTKILDVGSGTGDWVFHMCASFPLPDYTGIESDPVAMKKALERAKESGPASIRFRLGTAEEMPFSNEYDLVHLGEVLCVMNQRTQALKKCWEALKPGGVLVIGEGLLDGKKGWRGATNGLMRGMQLDYALLGASFLSRSELTSLLLEAGFNRLRFLTAGGGFWFAVARKPKSRGSNRRAEEGKATLFSRK
jgi:ubiquinone/menaquinone biosynthesis C-methylase UbiE